MALLVPRLVFASSTIFAATLMALPAVAQSKDEAPAAAKEAAAPAADEAPAPAPAPEAEAAKPAEPPKCDCPPPCPVPPPPPPAPPAPPADAVEWKAQTKGGMMITGGNSQSKNFTVGVNASRKEGDNKLALEGGLNYGTSNISVGTPDADGIIQEVHREKVVSTNNWAAKGRYDRFVTPNNSAFASGLAAADKVAGKSFFGGGQVGYSRQLLKDDLNTLVAELGYDFSYEKYVAGNDPISIHSARVFVGETLSLTKDTGVTASLEALFNLNKETKAINAKDGSVGVSAFKDTRVNGKMQLTTNLWKSLGFGFGVGFKYDQNPAPRPVPKGGSKWPPQYWSLAFAQHWDVVTEATLLYTFF